MTPLTKILFGIGAALALVVIIAFVWLVLANAHLKTELAQAQANNTACHLANDEFASSIAAQNKAVEAMKAQSEAQAARVKLAELAAQKKIAVYKLAASRLNKMTATGDACRAADDLFTAYLGVAK